jgi:outer membrane receptor for ferrienterochelin and colicins
VLARGPAIFLYAGVADWRSRDQEGRHPEMRTRRWVTFAAAAGLAAFARLALAQTEEPPAEEHPPGTWSPSAIWRPTGALAREEELALAELLNSSATVASKSSASVSRSPGMVTVYQAEDIRRLGYYTMAELADVTAGYSSHLVFGEKVFESRGQKAGSFINNKHLVLVDGIPVNHARGNKAMIDENFPLFFADRVEFLKGPASALYGTGAFFGVVNLTPKEMEDPGFRAEARAGMGNQQSSMRVAANALYRDRVRHAAVHVGFFDKGPSGWPTGAGENPDNRFWDDQRSEFLYLSYGIDAGWLRGLKGGFIYASKNGGLGEHWLGGYSPTYNDLSWVQVIPYLKYERRLTRTLQLDGYFKASQDGEKATAAATTTSVSTAPADLVLLYGIGVAAYEGLVELRWQPTTMWHFIGGVNVNVSYQKDGLGDFGGYVSSRPGSVFIANPRTLNSNDIFQTYSGFVQMAASLPVLAGLHITTGVRLDMGKALDAAFWQLSPRAGIVQELTEWLSLKLLYDTALRAPGIKELGLNKEVRPELADPAQAAELEPETMRSLEGGVAFHSTHLHVSAALFVNETRDALDGRLAAGADGTPKNIFTNTPGKIVARGAELELTLAASADTRLFANYSIAKAVLSPEPALTHPDRSEVLDLADVPIHRVNGGVSYRLLRPLDLTGTLVGRWVSGYRGAPAIAEQPARPDAPGHLLLDLNLIARLTEHTSLELLARNLTDAAYKLPQAARPYIPMPGRSFHLTLDYRW